MCVCENCNKEFTPIDNYHTRFCCNQCARSFSSKYNRGKRKVVYCEKCHKELDVSINSSKKLCDKCQAEEYALEYNKTHIWKKHYGQAGVCRICGRLKTGKCEFCKNHSIKFINSLVKNNDLDVTKIGTSEIFDEVDMVMNKTIDNSQHNDNDDKYINVKRRKFHNASINKILNDMTNSKYMRYKIDNEKFWKHSKFSK